MQQYDIIYALEHWELQLNIKRFKEYNMSKQFTSL